MILLATSAGKKNYTTSFSESYYLNGLDKYTRKENRMFCDVTHCFWFSFFYASCLIVFMQFYGDQNLDPKQNFVWITNKYAMNNLGKKLQVIYSPYYI